MDVVWDMERDGGEKEGMDRRLHRSQEKKKKKRIVLTLI